MKNQPYVKVLDANGLVTNPIILSYQNEFANRSTRRQKDAPFKGNGKNFSLTVTGKLRYLRVVQEILLKDGSIKRIGHYVLRNNIEPSLKSRRP